MDQLKEEQIQSDFIETRTVESIAILKVKQNGFNNLAKIDVNSRLFE